jgi:hypothetical protein
MAQKADQGWHWRGHPMWHLGDRDKAMRELNDATLDFDLRIDRSDPSGRILPVIHYFIRERTEQTATDDNQTSTLLIMHQLDR